MIMLASNSKYWVGSGHTKWTHGQLWVAPVVLSETSYRPGGGETICPRRRQFDSRRIYVRPRTSLVAGQLQAASVTVA